ncbi:MAG: ATP-binding protein [Thermacetogeniaceae bacterium]
MQVVGVTTQQYIYVASRERKFRINEILIVEDAENNYPRGEVIETKSFNRFIPLSMERSPLIDSKVWEGLEQVGFRLGEETIHLARVRLLGDLSSPVEVGARVRLPDFSEVEDLLVPCRPENGLVLGVILGTEDLKEGLPPELRDIAPLYVKGEGVLPQSAVPFIFDYKSMQEYPHIGIFGGSGSGKSFGLRVILEELLEKRIPALVFDPHYEMSFSTPFEGMDERWASAYKERTDILTVGRDTGVNFEELTANDLSSLLAAAGSNFTEGMDNALKAIHQERDSFASFSQKLEDLIALAEKEEETLENIRRRYGDNSKYEKTLLSMAKQAGHPSSLRGIRWRLYRLEREGIFQKGVEPIIDSLRARRLAVIRGPIWLLTVFGAYLVRKLYRMRRNYTDALQRGEAPEEKFPPFLVVTDEAHNFAPKGIEVPAPARSVFREVAQEGRKYGVFLVLATQRPALLDETITAQLNTKFIFRTVRASDIRVIEEETDITSEEARRLPYLSSGTAFVSSAVVGRTLAVRIRCARTRAPHTVNPFTELEEDFREAEEAVWRVIEKFLPLDLGQVNLYLPDIEEELKRSVSFSEVKEWLEGFARKGRIVKTAGPFGPIYSRSGEDE